MAKIPLQMASGVSVAVARTFPAKTTAHRPQLRYKGDPVKDGEQLNGNDGRNYTTVPACGAADPHHPVTAAYADSLGAQACVKAQCFPEAKR